jgi:hypothetical protein
MPALREMSSVGLEEKRKQGAEKSKQDVRNFLADMILTSIAD